MIEQRTLAWAVSLEIHQDGIDVLRDDKPCRLWASTNQDRWGCKSSWGATRQVARSREARWMSLKTSSHFGGWLRNLQGEPHSLFCLEHIRSPAHSVSRSHFIGFHPILSNPRSTEHHFRCTECHLRTSNDNQAA